MAVLKGKTLSLTQTTTEKTRIQNPNKRLVQLIKCSENCNNATNEASTGKKLPRMYTRKKKRYKSKV